MKHEQSNQLLIRELWFEIESFNKKLTDNFR